MNASSVTWPIARTRHSILREPFRAMNAAALLEHFATRTDVCFFPVPDPDETTPEKIDDVLRYRFTFGGETCRFDGEMCWTVNPSADVEWHILLHKFPYATGLGMSYDASGDRRYLECWIALTRSWIEQTPIGFIAADVTARRVQNWIYAYYWFVARNRAPLPPDFHELFLVSLWEQVDYLIANLHPARNHRTLELYAIFLAAVVFPEMADAARWRRFALREIVVNMQSDLLPDGVQCELSTDYHHLVVKNYVNVRRLARLNAIDVPVAMDVMLQRALEFCMHAHRPDGFVPSFSDGDTHSYLDLLQQGFELYGREDMLYVASRGKLGTPPARRSAAFPDSGYYIQRSRWDAPGERFEDARFLMLDCGPLGAGNHGHLDALSIEVAAFGEPLVVDPGRYTYSEAGEVNWRARFRGTAYHNTVLVDGSNQTKYLPGPTRFKIRGPAPETRVAALVSEPHFDLVHGSARSAEYDALHERRVAMLCGEYWIVSDRLHGSIPHRYDLLFHLSSAAQGAVRLSGEGEALVVHAPHLVLAQLDGEGMESAIEDGFVSLRYGSKLCAPVVRFTRHATNATFHTVLHPYRDAPPALRLQALQIRRSDEDSASDASGISVTVRRGDVVFSDIWFFAGQRGQWHRFGDYEYDGDCLWLRLGADGEVADGYVQPGATLKRGRTGVATRSMADAN